MILQYFLPGYWAVKLFAFLHSQKIDSKATWIVSCLVSYLSITIISLFVKIDDTLVMSGISFLVLTVGTIILSFICSAKWFKRALTNSFHKSLYDDIWHSVLDLDNGSNLKVYFKGSDIGVFGSYSVHEENGEDSWFGVSAPIKFNTETDEITDERQKDNRECKYIFRLRDVDHIEVY